MLDLAGAPNGCHSDTRALDEPGLELADVRQWPAGVVEPVHRAVLPDSIVV